MKKPLAFSVSPEQLFAGHLEPWGARVRENGRVPCTNPKRPKMRLRPTQKPKRSVLGTETKRAKPPDKLQEKSECKIRQNVLGPDRGLINRSKSQRPASSTACLPTPKPDQVYENFLRSFRGKGKKGGQKRGAYVLVWWGRAFLQLHLGLKKGLDRSALPQQRWKSVYPDGMTRFFLQNTYEAGDFHQTLHMFLK